MLIRDIYKIDDFEFKEDMRHTQNFVSTVL